MRTKATSFGQILLATAVPCLGAACGGGVTTDGADPVARSAAFEQSVESPASGATPFTRHVPREALRFARKGGAGSGSAQWVLCGAGASCAGALAQTEFEAEFVSAHASDDAGTAASDAGPTCTYVVQGSCQTTTCTTGGGGGGGGGSGGGSGLVGAGTLTIGGGTLGSVALKPRKADGLAYVFGQSGALFAGGDTLTIEASGGTVPAFSTQSLAAPGLITLVKPAADKKGAYNLATSSPLHLVWSGGTAGDAVFVEGDASTATTSVTLACEWDAAQGEATVPAAVLAPMAGLSGDLLWGQIASNTFDAARYVIPHSALAYGDAPATYE